MPCTGPYKETLILRGGVPRPLVMTEMSIVPNPIYMYLLFPIHTYIHIYDSLFYKLGTVRD